MKKHDFVSSRVIKFANMLRVFLVIRKRALSNLVITRFYYRSKISIDEHFI